MMEFQSPCSGSTAAVATWYSYGDVPLIQLWMRFRLLGIQVTRTLIANKKLVRRYARLTGSATTNRRAALFVPFQAFFAGDGFALLCFCIGDSTVEK